MGKIRLRTLGASLLSIVVLLALVSAGTAQAAPTSASTSHAKSWQVVSSPNTPATYNSLGGLAAFSANDVWAIGTAQYYPTPALPIVEHWNGTQWQMVSPPASVTGTGFNAIATIPGTHDFWVLGNNGLAALSNGTTWKIIPTANVNSPRFFSVFALSATDAWIVGEYSRDDMPNAALIEHWNGTEWSQVPVGYPSSSHYSFLYSITALSTTDVWAVGQYENVAMGPGYALTEHWNGQQWSFVSAPSPGPNDNELFSVTSIPHTNHLLAAGYQLGDREHSLIEYWDGTKWSVVSTPSVGANDMLSGGIVALSDNNAWAVGKYTYGQGDDETLVEHWNGKTWSLVSSPNPTTVSFLSALVRVPHSQTLWAAGYYYDSHFNELTLTERYR